MEENKEIIQNKIEKKKNGKLKWTALFLAVALTGGSIYFFTKGGNKTTNSTYTPPVVNKETITQEEFENLPVGVIYEFSEEEQKQFLEEAKKKYETYKDAMPEAHTEVWTCNAVENKCEGSKYLTEVPIQYSTVCTYNPDGTPFYGDLGACDQLDEIASYKERPDVTNRKNESPTDMLNNDGSLKYPDGFYGYVEYDNSLDDYSNSNGLSKIDNITDKVNQILLYEDYYLTNNVVANNIKGSWEAFIDKKLDYTQNYYTFTATLEKKYLNSTLASKQLNGTRAFIDYMFAGDYDVDIYQVAKEYSNRDLGSFSIVEYMESIPSKYNIYDSVDKKGVAFYYPTKVWKINNGTIVVDIRIDGGSTLRTNDVVEIQGKIMQCNVDKYNVQTIYDEAQTYSDGKYIVYARYFDSDMTSGLIPDFGSSIVNYTMFDGLAPNSAEFKRIKYASDYAYNDTAKEVVRRYYAILSEKYSNGESFSSKEILTQVANETGVPYMDALNIWATYYISHFVNHNYYQNGVK